MGVVYRARDRRLNRVVALKFLIADTSEAGSESLRRFQREAEAIAALNHAGVATIYESGTWDGSPFLALEFMGGGTLRDRVAAPLSFPEIIDYSTQLGSGLAFAHSRGILHRDIKPANCMFTDSGALKLVDFGLAKLAGAEDLTQPGSTMGTIPYMAPELLRGEPATVRSDLYALGAVVYEMAAGRPLYRGGGPGALLHKILEGSATPLAQLRPDLPPAFCSTVGRAIAPRAEDRFGSIKEFVEQLRQPALSNSTADTTPTATMRRPDAATGRGWKWLRLAAAVAVLLAAAVFAVLRFGSWGVSAAETMVVLPFDNLGGDPANQALCDGLQETVTSVLSSAEELRDRLMIVPSSEVRRSQIHTIPEARKQFNATLALTGSAQKSLQNLQLTLDLTDVRRLRQKDSRILTIPAGEAAGLQRQLEDSLGAMLGAGPLVQRRRNVGDTTANSTAYDLFLQGRGALEDRNLDDAVTFLKKAVDADPGFALARAKLAEAYLRQNLSTHDPKWLAMADAEVAKAASAGQSPEVLMSQALIRKAMGNWEETIRLFQLVLKSDPANVEAYRFLADAWDSAGNMKEAEATYRHALSLRPGYWPLYDSLGNFYANHQQYSQAEQAFSTGISLAPDVPTLYYNLGALYFRMGRWPDAGRAFEKSLAVKPTALGYANLGTVRFFEGNYAEAAKQCEAATRLQPANPINWGNLGDSLWQLRGGKERAQAAFEKAASLASQQLAINADNPRLRKLYALYLAKLGRSAEAVAEVRRAQAQAPNDGSVDFYAARAYAVLGDADAALRELRNSLKLGYSAMEIAREPDFAALKKDPRYQEISGGAAH
jgi:tetratricopeptide (TPR) repeat protein/TolB-like protein